MLLAADSDVTTIATTLQSTTSTLHPPTLTVTATHTGRQQDQGSLDATAMPVISQMQMKTIMKDAKDYVFAKTLNQCGFCDSSSCLTMVWDALADMCSSIIEDNWSINPWIDKNISTLYKTIITPMLTILNWFKKCGQDLVENLYGLEMSIWTDMMIQADHIKTAINFLIRQSSLNFIFGDTLEDGREVCYPFEHKATFQITSHAAFCDGYNKFIDSDDNLDNIMAMSGTAAFCCLLEFATSVFKQIDFTYIDFQKLRCPTLPPIGSMR
ncbi:hypothetical protein BDR04DRAFT_1115384 [Suillus decipiens]|nr:hypothetical protein BDR04DRAFT_1115384 [Suillus decipiens]